MNKFVLFLALFSLSVANVAPIGHAMDSAKTESSSTYNVFHTETLDKEGAEEKILFDFSYNHSSEVARSGHLLHDIFSTPPERFYLPYEPPIA